MGRGISTILLCRYRFHIRCMSIRVNPIGQIFLICSVGPFYGVVRGMRCVLMRCVVPGRLDLRDFSRYPVEAVSS